MLHRFDFFKKVKDLPGDIVEIGRLDNMNIDKKYILIKGDVADTLPVFVEENPGFKDLLYI